MLHPIESLSTFILSILSLNDPNPLPKLPERSALWSLSQFPRFVKNRDGDIGQPISDFIGSKGGCGDIEVFVLVVKDLDRYQHKLIIDCLNPY